MKLLYRHAILNSLFFIILWSANFLVYSEEMQEAPSDLRANVRILLQNSPLAGSQFYDLKNFTEKMQLNDSLKLVREPENRYDKWAIRVEWQGNKLGYVPRRENQSIAEIMDQGAFLGAKISALRVHENPWKRLEFEIFLSL